jgi:hypothetical protein
LWINIPPLRRNYAQQAIKLNRQSYSMMLFWPLCSNNAFSGSTTTSPRGNAVAAVSIGGSFRLAIADIQLLHESIMLSSATLFCLFCIINGHITPLLREPVK